MNEVTTYGPSVTAWAGRVALLCVVTLAAGCGCRDEPPRRVPIPSVAQSPLSGMAPLGSAPLCEPSAALTAPWDAEAILVADNEVHDTLFVFRRGPEGRLLDQRQLPMPGQGPRDVEALAALGRDLLVVGSNSRNKRCETKKKRARIRQLRWEADTGRLAVVHQIEAQESWNASLLDETTCGRTLFTQPPPPGAREVCTTLVAASRTKEACHTQNIEGAAATPDGRIWLGLRSPLVGGRAVAMRLVWPSDALRFDAVSFLDLGGDGVRELTVSGANVFILAGPPLDSTAEFGLWRAPVDSFADNPSPAIVRTVPTSSEGLLVRDEDFLTLIDGAEGDNADQCDLPGQQFRVAR